MRFRFAPEGWLFIVPAVIVTAAALLIQWHVAAIVLGLVTLFLINFFRDPQRVAGSERHVDVLSPADGTVVQIIDVAGREPWPGLTKQVSIFMSVFDVHVNRAPMTGRIVHYRYNPGRRIAALAEKSSEQNEQNLVVIEDGHGGVVALEQIAGLLARRIVFDKKEGDEVVRGERIGMIKFGSRVDVFFQPAAVLKVQMRDKVKVGVTVIAAIEEHT